MSSDSITIDPVAMNIVNRIAPGTTQSGELICNGGLMVEGTLTGTVTINGGPLVLRTQGVISGNVTVNHDAYLLGTITEQGDGSLSEIIASGTVFLAATLNAAANIQAGAMKTYEGSRIDGRIRTGRWANSEASAEI